MARKYRGIARHLATGRSIVDELSEERIREARRERREVERDAKKLAKKFPGGLADMLEDLRQRHG